MRSRSWRTGLACAALAVATSGTWAPPGSAGSIAFAAGRDWTGSERCGSCHPAQLAAWRATAHARPFAAAGQGRATVCLGCHTTGESPAGPVIESSVGCEACHGAGADYSAEDIMRNRRLAFDLGLVDFSASLAPAPTPSARPAPRSPATMRAAVCAGCHRALPLRPGQVPIDLSQLAHPPIAPGAGGAAAQAVRP